jgi:hypothetical protein
MNALKICLISFDNWHYDSFIIEALRKKNIDAYHIKLGAYKHASLTSRIINAFNKIIFRKNPKHIKKQEYILDQLKHHGMHDQILVINPNVIDLAYHKKIKEYNRAIKQIQSAYNKGNLTEDQYNRFINEINQLIIQVKKEGGIID